MVMMIHAASSIPIIDYIHSIFWLKNIFIAHICVGSSYFYNYILICISSDIFVKLFQEYRGGA